MPDQPTGPVDTAAAAMVRSQANMFTKTPDVPTRTPSADEMRNAELTAGQRGQTTAERSADYMRQYDRPTERPIEAKPDNSAAAEKTQKQPSEQVSADQTDEMRELASYRAWQSQQLSFKAELPDPSAYRVELPESFKLPTGIEFKFNENDPLIANAREWAHRNHLSQDQFSEALSLHAATQIGIQQQMKEAREKEVKALGASGPGRIDAVVGWLNSTLGKELSGELQKMLVTEKMVRGFEKIIGTFVNQGVGQFNNVGREPQSRGPSDSEWNSMSWHERREYQRGVALAAAPQRRR